MGFGDAAGRRARRNRVEKNPVPVADGKERKAALEGGAGAEGEDTRRVGARLGGTRNAATQPRAHGIHIKLPIEP